MSADDKKRIGIRELAKLARVSVGTIDRALNGRPKVSEVTRNKILKLAKQTTTFRIRMRGHFPFGDPQFA